MSERPAAPRRHNIQDIAAAAGVSAASVSYALNGKPGVSQATRDRILAIAKEHDWEPNRLAQALHSARTDVVGYVVPATSEALRTEPFWLLFISGLEQELRLHGKSLLLHTEQHQDVELDIYRRWYKRGIVDAVVLTDLSHGDVRIPLLQEIGLPVVLAGKPDPDPGLSYAYASDAYDMEQLLHHLSGLGLRRLAHLAGDPRFLFVRERGVTLASFVAEYGLPDALTTNVGFVSEELVLEAVRGFLSAPEPPEVIIADSDLLALWTMRALAADGVAVPDEVQVVSFDDSALCDLVSPSITALDRRPHELGRAAGRLVVNAAQGQRISRIQPAEIRWRQSTRPLA